MSIYTKSDASLSTAAEPFAVQELLLDAYPGAVLAYSTARQLRKGYSGPCFRVKRGVDELDIGFYRRKTNVQAISDFAGMGTASVATFYDQSVSGFNATQSTEALQPLISSAGLVVERNRQPILNVQAGHTLIASAAGGIARNKSKLFIFFVVNATVGVGGQSLIIISNSLGTDLARASISFARTGGDSKFFTGGRRLDGDAFTGLFATKERLNYLTELCAEFDYAGGALRIYENGVLQSTGALPSAGNSSDTASLAVRLFAVEVAGSYSQKFTGYVGEIVIYNTDISTSRAKISKNMRDAWGIL